MRHSDVEHFEGSVSVDQQTMRSSAIGNNSHIILLNAQHNSLSQGPHFYGQTAEELFIYIDIILTSVIRYQICSFQGRSLTTQSPALFNIMLFIRLLFILGAALIAVVGAVNTTCPDCKDRDRYEIHCGCRGKPNASRKDTFCTLAGPKDLKLCTFAWYVSNHFDGKKKDPIGLYDSKCNMIGRLDRMKEFSILSQLPKFVVIKWAHKSIKIDVWYNHRKYAWNYINTTKFMAIKNGEAVPAWKLKFDSDGFAGVNEDYIHDPKSHKMPSNNKTHPYDWAVGFSHGLMFYLYDTYDLGGDRPYHDTVLS